MTEVSGAVDVTMAGQKRSVDVDTIVELTARIITGSDGHLGIRQAQTTLSVAPNTDVEIPETAMDGQLIARLVQRRGNVFYDVQQRDVGKLRVETPYLVAVVKGTQFNVAVQNDTATISLYEGSLEITTPDGSESVDIEAGEIAIRSGTDASIRVFSMNADELPQPAAGRIDAPDALAGGTAAVSIDDSRPLTELDPGAELAALPESLRDSLEMPGAGLGMQPANATGIGESITIDSGIGLDLGGGMVDAGLGVNIGLDTGLDLGAATADIGLDAGLDLGAGSADIGLDTSLDLGAATAHIGLDASLDLGAGSADIGLDTGLDLGAATADLGLDAGLDVGLDLGGSEGTEVAADIDLDLGGIGLGTDVSLGDQGLEVGVDLGGGGSGALDVIPQVIDQVGGLLGGIL